MARIGLIIGLLIFLSPFEAFSYPHFIGYKYSSCLTCHYNGQGNGPINDYGRALWAAEIAGRMFAGGRTPEQLGEASGFLGKTQLPWWVRPGLKARQLYVIANPGSKGETSRDILMQAEANAAVFFDKNQKYTFVGSFGYVPEPLALQGSGEKIDTWISREHYLRVQALENLWVYLGMLDKVYGIRHANHTAYSRSRTGIAQNDQAHGVVLHYIKPKWELTGNYFLGNLNQSERLRQVGFSGLFEYEIKENWRLGATFLNSSSKIVEHQRLGILSRAGYGLGASLLFELGLITNTPKPGEAKQGYYMYSEIMQKVVQGYHLFISAQAYKPELKGSSADNIKLGAGLLAFPMQRVEFRLEAENTQTIANGSEVAPDSWAVLGQIHLSL